jgi:hypothetical protein
VSDYTVWDGQDEADELTEVTVTGVHRHEGSIVLFTGITNDESSTEVVFAVDYRPACDLEYALDHADHEILVVIEPWQIWNTTRSAA